MKKPCPIRKRAKDMKRHFTEDADDIQSHENIQYHYPLRNAN